MGAGALLVGGAGATGLALATSVTAHAVTTQTASVTENFTCATNKPVALTKLPVPVVLSITAPTSVTTGTKFTESASSSVTLPAAITATASALGITSITVTNVAAGVNASNATPASATDGGQGLPMTIAVANIGNPVVVDLAPLTFTAGKAGTPMVFTAGDLTVTTTLHGGTFDGTITTLSCTANTGNPSLGSVNVTAAPVSPVVTGVSPTGGSTAGGDTVTITGTGFTGATGVDFGTGNAATNVKVVSSTTITATAPPGSGTVDVTVTGPNGTSTTSSADHYTFSAPVTAPTITGISPTGGPAAGSTSVDITGTGFTGATQVDFGAGNPAVTYKVNSATDITAVSPAGTAGATVNVTVTGPNGTSAKSSADQFTYQSGPVITGVSPDTGSTDGGTKVTVSGTGFSGALDVYFGLNQASSFTVTSNTSITATSPPGAPGAVDITVVTPNGFTSPVTADTFTYVQPAPVLKAINPSSGPTTGGTTVTLTGTDLGGVTAVAFGPNAGTITGNTATSVTVTSPAGKAGATSVTITTGGGISNAETFTYVPPAPTLTKISPSTGTTDGGTSVTLTGTNLASASAVDFGSVAGTVTSDTATSITVTSPAGAAGQVGVTVKTAGGTSNREAYTYVVPQPALTGIKPSSGPVAGGTTVTLTGTNLANASSVDFGSGNAGTITSDTATSITVTSPASTSSTGGPVSVTVTTAGGTSNGETFTYVPPVPQPKLTGINPSSGPAAGGTKVTLTGTGLSGATSVMFGSKPATVTADTFTSIMVDSPAGSTGPVNVTVTTGGGTSNTETFTYTTGPVPSVMRMFPSSGSTSGYTLVWVMGSNFTSVDKVTFGGKAALYRVFSPRLLIALSPPASSTGTVDVQVTNANGTSATSRADHFTYVREFCFLWFCFGVGD